MPKAQAGDNKYTRGHALIYGGYPMTGAGRMAARAAARAGAGLVTVAVPEVAFPIYAASLASIIVHPLAPAEDLTGLVSDERITAFLVGPGAGVNNNTRRHALAMLETGKPTVLDADAITIFHDDTGSLDWGITGPCVLTPHEGEFARIFDSGGDRLERAKKAAMRSGAVIVLKGHNTLIVEPGGKAIINNNAPPTLATAGSGDVLSGIIVGLLAQGMEPFLAAAAAVWIHGAAAAKFGPGLIAEDLPDLLPEILGSIF